MERIRRTAAIVSLLLGTVSCTPALAHGPRVEHGLHGGVTIGYETTRVIRSGDDDFPLGPIGVDIAYGTTRDSTSGAFRTGLHVPAGIAYLASQLDLYAEAPPQWFAEWDAGFGASLSLYHVMPYVQLGRRTPDGSGWYTTQGVNVVQSGAGSMAVLWMPGVAYAWRRERST